MELTAPPFQNLPPFPLRSRNIHTALLFNSSHKSLLPNKPPNLLSASLLFSPSSQPSRFGVTRVTTVPVEFAPPTPDFGFHQELARLRTLRAKLSNSKTLSDKLRVIDCDSRVKRVFTARGNGISRVLESVKLEKFELFLIKCVVAAGQEHVFGWGSVGDAGESDAELRSAKDSLKSALYALAEMIEKWDGAGSNGVRLLKKKVGGMEIQALTALLKNLRQVEEFYDCIGGIIGYQLTVLELLAQLTTEGKALNWSQHITNSAERQYLEIHPPTVLDLSQDTEYASQAALWGIEGLPNIGEIYPLGGSADRLGLVDSVTGECLPAAMLPFCGRTLLEGLIRDLQAREFLYFKLYGEQCITPVAIMTSSAKKNHEHITSLCERFKWFGRGQSSFHLFEQPLVPAVSAEDGQWLVKGQFMPVCKPGGHGVIWKLAYNKGVFQWFRDHERKGATVRQVSNVVAATDVTLLALAGIGLYHEKKLGFASCERNTGATEGINVLVEKRVSDGKWAYGFSCIEYTEFDKFGITDGSGSPSSLQTEFPANTNILYVDLHAAELIGSSNNETSLPGMVLNVKKQIKFVDQFGMQHSVPGGRLECTMQNIADNFINTYSSRRFNDSEDMLDTFIAYNKRRKVTSSAKKKRRHADKSLHQTPEGALLDTIRNAYDLLSHCDIELAEIEDNDKYANSGPPYIILLHPALGPLWEVTRQKFHGGSMSKGSELQIEVAEFLWRNVQLEGSLIVVADNVMGSAQLNESSEGILQYGHRCGRCKLKNVKVVNDGVDWNSKANVYWKHDLERFEALKITLHGNAEFEAVDVFLQGNHTFEVPDGYRMKVTSGNSGPRRSITECSKATTSITKRPSRLFNISTLPVYKDEQIITTMPQPHVLMFNNPVKSY